MDAVRRGTAHSIVESSVTADMWSGGCGSGRMVPPWRLDAGQREDERGAFRVLAVLVTADM